MRRKDNRPWRKLVKKLRRKRIRQEASGASGAEPPTTTLATLVDKGFFLTKEEWKRREDYAEALYSYILSEERRLAKENEEREEERRQEREQLEKEVIRKQARMSGSPMRLIEDYSKYLDFLCGDIETPPVSYLMPEIEGEVCSLFLKTGACRFFERCKLIHPTPTLSRTIVIRNFFTHFMLEQGLKDAMMDIGLEFENSELQGDFLEFYGDVLPEFRKYGKVLQFKVCCNMEPHLRGNVYVQYENIRSAVEAFRVFNARFYNGKQISLRFVRIDSWRSAICWSFLRRSCVKGGSCNYLHVFRNPTKEFVAADGDWNLKKDRCQASDKMKSITAAPAGLSSSRYPSNSSNIHVHPIHSDPTNNAPSTSTSTKCSNSQSMEKSSPTRTKSPRRSKSSRSSSKHKKKKSKHKKRKCQKQ